MRRVILGLILAGLSSLCSAQIAGFVRPEDIAASRVEQPKEWSVPEVVCFGKEDPRAFFMSYLNRELAVENDYNKADYYFSLNGQWDFCYFDDHRNAPTENFFKVNYNTTNWQTINVPGNWEPQGFGTAIYTNIPYEFAPSNPQPPTLPDAIPVGLYRTTFEVTLPMRDRDVFLCFDGVKGSTTIYINGQKAGYTEDGKSRAEFLINNYLVEGTNTLAVEVMRWGTGSYLECQDFWRISGIERDVFLWCQPKTRIDDFRVVATLDSTYTKGLFNLDIALKNSFVRSSGYMQVWYELENQLGELVDYNYVEMEMAGNSVDTLRFKREFPIIEKWTAETPYLYTLVMKIKKDGRFVEYTSAKIGFRTSEVVGNEYLVNGKRVLIKGVNYHEHDEVTGHYLSPETIQKDMLLMKQANINAIRLSHYPQGRRFYEMADKYGFYLVNEANIESHGMHYDLRKGGSLGNNPQWINAHLERTQNMYEQSKNHPSVMIWSLGNEAGNGYNFYKTYLYLKQIDTLRPVQYERALLEWNTDIFCPQYPSAQSFRNWAEQTTDRPYIPSEYLHSMGNSGGGMRQMWDAIYASDNLQGGFIWDWVDQGLLKYNADSTDITWYYGGDYMLSSGEAAPSDGNFLCNGLVSPDRTPKPALMSEVKKNYQYVGFDEVDIAKGKFRVTNLYDFTSLEKYKVTWRVKNSKKTLSSGVLALDLKPSESKMITIAGINPRSKVAGEDYFIDFSVVLKGDDGLLKKGYEVASDQFQLPNSAPKKRYNTSGSLRLDDDSEVISVSSSYFNLLIDKNSGNLVSYSVNGRQMIADEEGLRPLFWRASNDNDFGAQLPIKMEEFRTASNNLMATNVEITSQKNSVAVVSSTYDLPHQCTLNITYTIYNTGVVNVGYSFKGKAHSDALIPRLGMRMRLPEDFSELAYYGRGPQENYVDRNWGTDVGYYKSNPLSEAFDYVRPQETGHHTDTRFLSLTTKRYGGIAVVADETMGFNALRNSVEDFDAEGAKAKRYPYQWNNRTKDEVHNNSEAYGRKPRQTHSWDIAKEDFVELSLDYKQMGVGGDDSWGAMPYEEYLIRANKDVEWGFTIVPIKSASDAHTAANYKY